MIVVHSPDQKLFEQAIFIIRDGAREVSDDVLLKEANRLIKNSPEHGKRKLYEYGAFWAISGALVMAAVWGLTTVL